MTIAIDARPIEGNITGVGRYLSNLLRYWKDDAGAEFLLYFKERIPEYDFLKSRHFRLKLIEYPIKSNALWQHRALPRQLTQDNPDVFFSPSYILPFGWNGKSVLALHDISYEAHPEWFPQKERILLRQMSRISAKKAARIITISAFSKKEIMRHYRIAERNIITVHLGPDPDFRKLSAAETEKRTPEFEKKFGVERGFLLFAGSLFTRRHPREMIRSFVSFKDAHGSSHAFLICGKDMTYPKEHIAKLVRDANKTLAHEAIVLVDHLSEADLLTAYNLAGAVIYLSDYEGFGLPPIEALACGTPVIVSDTEVSREVMGENACYVSDNTNTKEIAAALRDVLGDEEIRTMILRNAQQRLENFSFQKCAQETLDALIATVHV